MYDFDFTTEQAAQLLSNAWQYPISTRTVVILVKAGALTNVGTGRAIRVRLSELEQFANMARRVDPHEWPGDIPLYRVSVIGLREDLVLNPDGSILRTHAGVDYSSAALLTPEMRELAWTGCWNVSDENIEQAIAEQAILFATTRGYISPDYVRQIVGYRRNPSGTGIWWETRPAPEEILDFVSYGLWMPVPRGPENDWARFGPNLSV